MGRPITAHAGRSVECHRQTGLSLPRLALLFRALRVGVRIAWAQTDSGEPVGGGPDGMMLIDHKWMGMGNWSVSMFVFMVFRDFRGSVCMWVMLVVLVRVCMCGCRVGVFECCGIIGWPHGEGQQACSGCDTR